MTTTPICPACGAKFSFDKSKLECKVCGLPDEVVRMGPQMVARWKRKTLGKAKPPDAHTVEQKLRKKVRTFPAAPKRRNKHGRRGVKA